MVAILGANSVSGGYEIDNSLRFNDGDASRLAFTPDGAGDRDTFTISLWFKRGVLGSEQRLFSAGPSLGTSNNNISSVRLQNNDQLIIFGEISQSVSFTLQTNRVFRDSSAWYHIVVAFDTENGTAANRIKLYVNGVQESSFSTANYMSQNVDTFFNAANVHNISYTGGNYFDGYIAEFNSIDGQQLAPSDFGETDDNGVWIPKEYDGDYGTNGYYLEFKETGTSANASGIGADTSGETNHWTVNNLAALDVTTDTPTNNFATMIPANNITLSEGNTKGVTTRTGNWDALHASIGLTSGKWYFEIKESTSGTFRVIGGVAGDPENWGNHFNGKGGTGDPTSTFNQTTTPFYGKGSWLSYWYDHQDTGTSTATALSSGDIVQFALDLDNYKLYIGVNGTFYDNDNSADGNPAGGSNPTVTIPSGAYTGRTFFPAFIIRDDAGSDDNIAEINFGNPAFGISSGNADANGYGNFEYAVPSGFYSICTKNLAEFG